MRTKGRLEFLRKCGRKVHWALGVWPLLQRGVLVADGSLGLSYRLLRCRVQYTKGMNGLPAG